MDSIEGARREFAETIRGLAALRSDGLVRAFASVPREEFVGPGPWQIVPPSEFGRGYVATPNADPRHLYDNVLVALDASRHLNNGEPAALARWLDSLELVPGNRLFHIGCGVGYYTAVAAEAVEPGGSVVGIELDPGLAARARQNLRRWRNVTVVAGDGGRRQVGAYDAIFVNAGATEPVPWWLDALCVEGRLLLPLTVDYPLQDHGAGHMLLVVRHPETYSARFVSPVGIYHCAGARTNEGNELLKRSYSKGGDECVRRLRRDTHPIEAQCWLHGPSFCLSSVAVEA
jgi:protein-L-isoaspartate(D-aspartate) O-methyltransferase